ncbi:MAG: hypothetical protein H5T61_12055 [Thermoflexales bacterium]|nr:hypothetical protein [Thermoflexales bacterium]
MRFTIHGFPIIAVGFVLAAILACAPSGFLTQPTPTIPPTSSPPDLSLAPEDVALYPLPIPGLGGRWLFYRGDRISLDITPRHLGAIPPGDLTVRIYRLKGTEREVLAEGTVGYPAFDGVPRARLAWAWDTRDTGGRETLVVHLDPDDRVQAGDEDPTNNVVTLTVRFVTDAARPAPEALATWATTTTNCCILHYLTCSRAERDLPVLIQTTERSVAFVQERLGTRLASPLEVYFIGRVIGQGGYAQEGVVLSYPDRLYTGEELEIVLRHEAVHLLDASLVGPATPPMLREGLAVWVAGGHYRPESIPSRAGALLRLDRYIPLARLAEDFYSHQHEIGYLEAAALVAYLVETYGWDEFLSFYRQTEEPTNMPPADALDRALHRSFGTGLEETERAFQAWLSDQPTTSEDARDLELTVRLFDTIRRYQQTDDPMAYFLSGWFPNAAEGKQRGIIADFLRRPRTVQAIAVELMFVSAQAALHQGALDQAALLIDGAERALDGDFSIPPASEYLAIARAVADRGSEAQRVEIGGDTAYVWVTPIMTTTACSSPQVWTLHRTDANWIAGE